MRRGLAWLGMAIILVVLNGIVMHRERLIASGRPVLLKLAPADPRSLMQGDYMRLGYDFGDMPEPPAPKGLAVMRLDARGAATFTRYDDGAPLASNEVAVRYQKADWRVRIAPDAWFFQEGQADHFAVAKYARVVVTSDGVVSLVGLLDENLRDL